MDLVTKSGNNEIIQTNNNQSVANFLQMSILNNSSNLGQYLLIKINGRK